MSGNRLEVAAPARRRNCVGAFTHELACKGGRPARSGRFAHFEPTRIGSFLYGLRGSNCPQMARDFRGDGAWLL